MTFDPKNLLDDIGWQILAELQENARIPFAELGRRVGLSAPAVAERVRRLEEAGIITGYRAQLNLEKIGLPIMAFIRISAMGDKSAHMSHLAHNLPEVLECHRGTGSDCFILKVIVSSIPHLEQLLDQLTSCGQLTTSIVLSSLLTDRVIRWSVDSPAQPGQNSR